MMLARIKRGAFVASLRLVEAQHAICGAMVRRETDPASRHAYAQMLAELLDASELEHLAALVADARARRRGASA